MSVHTATPMLVPTRTLISSIKIGPIAVFDVQAAVAHPGMLKTGLLGMSFLDKLYETSFRGDKLILKSVSLDDLDESNFIL